MSDTRILTIGVDATPAQRGVKMLTSALSDAMRSLRDFDKRARSVFDALDRLGKTDVSKVARQIRGTAQAIQTLNQVKVSKALLTNLQLLQRTLASFRFNADALRKVPDAMAALSRVRIDSRFVGLLNEVKAALKGFRGPPAGVEKWRSFFAALSSTRINPALAGELTALRAASAGFKAPTAASVRNLASLVQSLSTADAGRISAAAAALHKLNGLSFSIRGLGRGGSFGGLAASAKNGSAALSTLNTQASAARHALMLLYSALGGFSLASGVRGIFQTGNAFQTLQRTLGAVATTSGEVGGQMQFLTDLTSKMPVSLEAAAASYGRFTIAARLAGVTTEQAQQTFTGFSTAFAAMGVSAEGQKRAFDALIQIFSKGKIQAEEWRQQIGDHMAGAFALLAESMGITTAQLSKMMDEGKVLSSELPKLATLLQSRFGPAVEIAMQRASAQLTAFSNEWTNLKNIIFNSGFEAGLGVLAKSLTEALKTDTVRNFARDLGRSFEAAATYTVAFVKTVSGNAALFKTIMGGLAVVIGSVLARSLLFVLGPAISLTVTAFGVLGKAALAAQTRMLALPAVATLAAVALDQFANGGRATAAVLDAMGKAAKTVGAGLGDLFSNVAGGSLDKIGEDFAKSLKEAQDTASRIQNSPLFDPTAIQRNAELEAKNNAKKLAALTDAEQKVWDEINAVGKVNSEYEKQLKLIDSIAAKRGMSDAAQWKAVLAAQTLEDRNPVGALARDYRAELASMKAMTGEQKAINAAKAAQNDLIAKGIILTDQQAQALRDYQRGIAMMNGEIGNGIQRWTTQVKDWHDSMQDAIADGIAGLSDEITNFITGAEADFAGLARSILRTFVKISLDSLLKDLFGAMGMDGQKNGASLADEALSKLAGIGETITTAMTNVYTSGLTVNGQPLSGVGAGFVGSPELPSNKPGANVATGTFDEMKRGMDRFAVPASPSTFKVDRDVPLTNDAWTRKLELQTEEAAKAATRGMVDGLRGPLDDAMRTNLLPSSRPNAGLAAIDRNFGTGGALTPEQIAYYTRPFTPTPEMLSYRLGGKAAVRTNNPGAMWYSDWQKKYGAYTGGQSLADGTGQNNNIAMFPTKEAGAAAQFDLLNRLYGKMDVGSAVHKWTGKNAAYDSAYSRAVAKASGSRLDTPMSEILADRDRSIQLAKTAAAHEAGLKRYPMSDEQWQAGYNLFQAKNGLAKPGGLDPMATSGIDQLKAKLTEVSSAAQQSAPSLDQFKAKLNESGTSAQAAGQQTQMANQMKSTSEMQAAMNTQAAGAQAAAAGPQFQQAGTSIMTAGQQAQMAASSAQSAAPAMGGFGEGISSLLGPLSSAIPGLGQFGGAIMQLVQQLMMGGGGMMGGLFSEGGYSTKPVASAMLPAVAWANAPHFAEGTANTSGGSPAILHDNEAVIPLSRGRKVPVELDGGDSDRRGHAPQRSAVNNTFVFNGVADADSFRRSKQQVKAQMTSAMSRAAIRDGYNIAA